MQRDSIFFNEDRARCLLEKLVSINTCQPQGNELEAVRFVAALFEGTVAETKIIDHGGNRASLIVKILGSQVDRTIMFVGHLDTVPVGDETLWRFPPHLGHVESGILYGRGSTDMKGGVVAAILTAQHLLETASPPPVNVCFAFTADEEHLGLGALALSRESAFVGNVEELIVPEPTDLAIALGEKGALWLKIRARGKSCHASMPERGANALEALFAYAASFQSAFEKMVAPLPSHALLGRATCVPTQFSGGVSPNVVPDDCEMVFDVRTVPGMSGKNIISIAEQIADVVAGDKQGVSIEVHVLNDRDAVECRADAPMIQRLKKCLASRSLAVMEVGAKYYTDAAQIVPSLGIEQFAIIGPGFPADCHQTNESISLKSVVQATEVYVDFINSKGR